MENMFATIHGSAERRPGTRFVVATDTNQLARLIPFEVSTDDSYILELSNGSLVKTTSYSLDVC